MNEVVPILEQALARIEALEQVHAQLCREFKHLQQTVIDLASLSAAGSSEASIDLVAKVGEQIDTIRRALKVPGRSV